MIRVLSICLLSLFAMSLSFNNEVKTEQHFSKNYKIASSGKQQLIVFLQANDAFFKADCLPKIEKLTREKGIELIVKNAEDGAPEDLTSTPSVIYQNAAGRSIFAARYAEFATVENFIRTSRAVSQQRVLNCKQNVLVWNEGRMQVASPVKITALGGVKTKDFDENAFKTKAFEVIDKAMSKFNATAEACLLKTDRAFYLDFHPYRSADDKLFLSFEMFSQFSCVKPIFSELKTPLTGNFSDFETLFAQAAVVLEKEIVAQMQDSKIGDAVTPLSKSINLTVETDLGFATDGQRNVLVSSKAFNVDPRFGFELEYQKAIWLRGGVGNFQRIKNETDPTKKDLNFQPNIGVGLKLGRLTVDYALTNIGNVSQVLYSHIFSLKLDFKAPKAKV